MTLSGFNTLRASRLRMALMALQIADLATTLVILRLPGGYESNALLVSSGSQSANVFIAKLLSLALCSQLRRERPLTLVTLFFAAVVTWNISLLVRYFL